MNLSHQCFTHHDFQDVFSGMYFCCETNQVFRPKQEVIAQRLINNMEIDRIKTARIIPYLNGKAKRLAENTLKIISLKIQWVKTQFTA